MKENYALGRSWDEVRADLFTPEEITESDLRVAVIGEIIKARQEQGISQKQLEEMSGVKQPVIARMEKGATSPQLDTILKLLFPLGKTLAVVPISKKWSCCTMPKFPRKTPNMPLTKSLFLTLPRPRAACKNDFPQSPQLPQPAGNKN